MVRWINWLHQRVLSGSGPVRRDVKIQFTFLVQDSDAVFVVVGVSAHEEAGVKD